MGLGGWKAISKPFKDVYQAAVPEPIRDVYTPTLEKVDEQVLQPVDNFLQDSARDVYNYTTSIPGKTLGALGAGEKVQNFVTPPTWEEMGKPGEAFYNDFNEEAGILPPSWRQYAPQVAGTVLSIVNPFVGAAFNTAYNAGQMQANQKGMDWGKVGTNAAQNFGTAAIQYGVSELGNSMKAGNQATANSKAFASSPQGMHAGFEATQAAPSVGNIGGQSVKLASSPMESFNPASFASATTKSPTPFAQTSSTNSLDAFKPQTNAAPTQNVYNSAVNAGENITSNLGQTALTSALGGGAGISGATSEAPMASEGGLAQPANNDGLALDRWVSGNGVYDEQGYINGLQAINTNRMTQLSGTRDMSRENGRWDLNEGNDTPYGQQAGQIEQGAQKEAQDFADQYHAFSNLSALEKANPSNYDNNRTTNYWLNEAKAGYAPKNIMDTFGSYKQYAKPIEGFKSAWAPAQPAPTTPLGSFQPQQLLAKGM